MATTWDSRAWQQKRGKKRSAQLIWTKTKADSVLFAGYSGSTIEDRTIGLFWPALWRGFPGFREELLSRELVHPHPVNGQLKLKEVGLCIMWRSTRGWYSFDAICVVLKTHIYRTINAAMRILIMQQKQKTFSLLSLIYIYICFPQKSEFSLHCMRV